MARKKGQAKANQVPYQIKYMAIGIGIAFLSVLALFKWGVFGILLANGLRLFVGEAYGLLVITFIAIAAFMVWRGDLMNPSLRTLLGSIFIFCAVTTLLHVNVFYSREPLPNNIFVETFNAFKNDLVNSRMLNQVGGGLLGAIFYALFGFLFGKWGTYLLASILFIAGVILVSQVAPQTLQQWLRSFWQALKGFVHSLFPKSQVAEHDEEALAPTVDEQVDEESKQEPKVSFFKKLMQSFQQDEEEERPPFLQGGYQPAKPLESREWEPYREPERPREWKRQANAPERVLDLDYFDAMQHTKEEEPVSVPIVVNQQIVPEEPEVVKAEEPVATTESASAGHWHNQAHERQDLTTDQLDKVLNDESEPIVTKSRPKVSKQRYTLPGKDLLKKIPPVDQSEEYARINENIAKLEQTFESFGVKATVVKANLGPSVTKYEIQPAIGVKVSKIVSLSDDIALALAARDVRIEAPIPGKSLIGIEVPNTQVSPVSFWEIIDAALDSPNVLEVPLGRDISGTVCLADLSKMPHLLIAGATGSGKSVGMNVIIVSLLMKAKPEEVKFLMIDPKKVELTMYDDIPHLLAPVVTNPRKAAQALNKVVQEMERRYELFATTGVRNIDGYNEQVDNYNEENGTGYERLPKIVVFVDELADLMMVASNEVENAIIRLAQMARAAGIHMIIATQRPSVDVITGIIKANVPSRLAFAVSSGIDSRTILDSNGAEKLLGRGDMLFQPMGKNKPVRVQGAYISDSEVERITNFVKEQRPAEYDETMMVSDNDNGQMGSSDDEYFDEAVEMVRGLDTISISQLQRRFRIGYNRAARLIDDMEAQGIVSGQDGSKPRQVLIGEEV